MGTSKAISVVAEMNNNMINILRAKEKPANILKEDKAKEILKDKPKSKPLSVAKKLAAAALLGSAIGLGAVSAPDIKDKIDNYLMSPQEKAEKKVLDNAAKKYFDNINVSHIFLKI